MNRRDLYSFVREHISWILIGGAALSVAFTPKNYMLWVMAFWALATAYLVIGAQIRTRRAAKKFGGRILEFVFAPTPIGSLLETLSKHGVAADSIDEVHMMSCELKESLNYYENGHERERGMTTFAETLKRHPQIKVTIYGQSNSPVTHPRISLVKTKKRYTEHTNLLTTKDGRKFVWYEPYHNVVNGRHYFERGAYLFEVPSESAASVKRHLAELPLAA